MDNANALQEMRQYYLETVKKIKEDVSKHISKTKENASTRIRYSKLYTRLLISSGSDK